MPANHATAVDEIVAVLVPALTGVPTVWPNKSDSDIDKSSLWARVTIRHEGSRRVSLGARRENHTGSVYVQMFFPAGTGVEEVYTRPQAVLDALTDARTPNGVWFREVTLYEGGGDAVNNGDSEAYYPVLVQAGFNYDEFRT